MFVEGFNTASGKHCCNLPPKTVHMVPCCTIVSIPQAVSTVATRKNGVITDVVVSGTFQYRKR